MSDFVTGLLTGFMDKTADDIWKRKDAAQEYFNTKLEQAHQKAYEYSTFNREKMNSALQVARQLKSAGVPEDVIMAVANQNPDDLPTIYETIQDMQYKGVPVNEQFYRDLLKIDGEFNPGNENMASLLQKIYMPLQNNIQADPEGFEFDPRSTIWATMMGYNAMEKAMDKLGRTEVMDGASALDVLFSNPNSINHPLGDTSVTVDAALAGDSVRAAKAALTGEDEPSPHEQALLYNTWSNLVEEKRLSPDIISLDPEEREAAAKQKAADEWTKIFPNTPPIPQVAEVLGGGVTPSQTTLPKVLPDGEVLVKDNGDGTADWKLLDGTIVTFDNSLALEAFRMGEGISEAEPTASSISRGSIGR